MEPDKVTSYFIETLMELLDGSVASPNADKCRFTQKEVFRSAVNSLLKDIFDSFVVSVIKEGTTDDAWTWRLSRLRAALWPEDGDHGEEQPEPLHLPIKDVERVLGLDLALRLEVLLADRKVNEDLLLSLLDLLLHHLTQENDEKNPPVQNSSQTGAVALPKLLAKKLV